MTPALDEFHPIPNPPAQIGEPSVGAIFGEFAILLALAVLAIAAAHV